VGFLSTLENILEKEDDEEIRGKRLKYEYKINKAVS
jgi:hypothetical protein